MRFFSHFLAVVSFLSLSHCYPDPPTKPKDLKVGDLSYALEHLGFLVNTKQRRTGTTGMSMVVVSDDKVVYQGGSGMIDKKNSIPADEKSIYFLGSVSKIFTAIAVMQLVEQGKIQLDSPVAQYLPEFRIQSRFPAKPITVRQLLTHHSGLPGDQLNGWFFTDPNSDGIAEQDALLPGLRDTYLSHAPSTLAAYSNIGYSLLGLVVARVSRQTFPEYVRTQILVPLEMDHDSGFEYKDYGSLMSKGYTSGNQVTEPRIRDLSAGSLRSSAKSMGNFLKMLTGEGEFNGRTVLKRATLREMLRPQNANVEMDWDFSIGLGFWLNRDFATGVYYAGHGGDIPPFHASLVYSPEHRVAGLIVINTDAVASDGLEPILKEGIQKVIESKLGRDLPLPLDEQAKLGFGSLPTRRLPAEEPKEGRFATGVGLVDVMRNGEKWKIRFQGHKLDLEPANDGNYRLRFRAYGLVPIDVSELDSLALRFVRWKGETYLYFLSNGVGVGIAGFLGKQYQPQEISPVWRGYLGHYTLLQPDGTTKPSDETSYFQDLELVDRDGVLTLEFQLLVNGTEQKVTLPLLILNDREAVVYGIGKGMGESLIISESPGGSPESAPNTGVRLRYSGFELGQEKARR